MQIEFIDINSIREFENNSRTHSEHQVSQIINSIHEFGFTNPILIDKNNEIIAGHGRFMAAVKMKMATVPCIRLAHLSERQKRAYVIADNQIALNSGYDFEKLAKEIEQLSMAEFDLDLLGFDEQQLESILKVDFGEFDDDRVQVQSYERKKHADVVQDSLPTMFEPRSKPGDLWKLGNHFLMCGDPSRIDDVMYLMGVAKPKLMVTDAMDHLQNINQAFQNFPGDVVYVWHPIISAGAIALAMIESGFSIKTGIIWERPVAINARGHYHLKHEPCFYGVRNGADADWIGDRKQTTIWEIFGVADKPNSVQKPVECMFRAIKNHDGDVYDPFCVSGTTMIASEQIGRACFSMSDLAVNCDFAIARWENLTGKTAVLLSNKA